MSVDYQFVPLDDSYFKNRLDSIPTKNYPDGQTELIQRLKLSRLTLDLMRQFLIELSNTNCKSIYLTSKAESSDVDIDKNWSDDIYTFLDVLNYKGYRCRIEIDKEHFYPRHEYHGGFAYTYGEHRSIATAKITVYL